MKDRTLLTEQICFAIHTADQALAQVYRPMLADVGLTYPQFLVMMLLWEQDDRTVGELGRALRLQSNTLTPLLKRMEMQGFVLRRRDTVDERAVRTSLTEKGRALAAKAPAIRRCAAAATGLSSDELDALHATLQRLDANLRNAVREG